MGADADIAVVDLARAWTITDADVISKIDWTPYADRHVHGAIDATLVRGRVVYEDGNVTGEPGWGKQAIPVAAAVS